MELVLKDTEQKIEQIISLANNDSVLCNLLTRLITAFNQTRIVYRESPNNPLVVVGLTPLLLDMNREITEHLGRLKRV